MEDELEELIEKLTENVEVMNDENATKLQKGVAIEQAKHHSEMAYEKLRENLLEKNKQ